MHVKLRSVMEYFFIFFYKRIHILQIEQRPAGSLFIIREQSIRVVSCAEWISRLTGCGLRGSWARETQRAAAANPFKSGSLYMPLNTRL